MKNYKDYSGPDIIDSSAIQRRDFLTYTIAGTILGLLPSHLRAQDITGMELLPERVKTFARQAMQVYNKELVLDEAVLYQRESIKPGEKIITAEEIAEILRAGNLSEYVDDVSIHTPSTLKSNKVIVLLRQSHAESQLTQSGEYISGIDSSSKKNQFAIAQIGEALASMGVVFFGMENMWENYNNPVSIEKQHRDFDFSLLSEEYVRNFLEKHIDGTHKNREMSGIDYYPGLLALQIAYPQLDLIGVDYHRRNILHNYGIVTQQKERHQTYGSDIDIAWPQDNPENFLREILSQARGREVLEGLLARYRIDYAYFSVSTDEYGLDATKGALHEIIGRMNTHIDDENFRDLQDIPHRTIAANVGVIQYGALHNGFLQDANDMGITLIEVSPVGLGDSQIPEAMRNHSNFACEYMLQRIQILEKVLEI